jgi:hypothetical protein
MPDAAMDQQIERRAEPGRVVSPVAPGEGRLGRKTGFVVLQ